MRKPSDLFMGTEHKNTLKRIAEHHRTHCDDTVIVDLIYGLGGSGKTEIITHYVWTQWKKYKGGVFYFRGQSPSLLDVGCKEFLQRNEVDIPVLEQTPLNIRRLTRQWLATNKDWLMVIDDVDDPSLITSFLPENHNNLSNGHILITSSIISKWDDWYPVNMHPVNQLSEKDAAIYLIHNSLSHPRRSSKHAEKILKDMKKSNPSEYEDLMWLVGDNALHGLPLALKQASKYMASRGNVTYHNYAGLYRMRKTSLFEDTGETLVDWLTHHNIDTKYEAAILHVINKDVVKLKTLSDDILKQKPICMSGATLVKFKEAQEETELRYFVKMANRSRQNVLTTWKLNYDGLGRGTRDFLHLCCCLSSRIQIALLVDGAKYLHPGNVKDTIIDKRKSGSRGSETEIYERVLNLFCRLHQFSLASTVVGETMNEKDRQSLTRFGVFSIHHLLRQVVYMNFIHREEKIQSANNAIIMLEKMFPKIAEIKVDTIQGLQSEVIRDKQFTIALHTVALARQIQSICLDDEEIKDLNNTNNLFTVVGTYLRLLGRTRDAKVLYKLMVELGERRDPRRETELAEEYRYLGKVYYELKTYKKAENCFLESIQLYKNVDENDIRVAYAIQGLCKVRQNSEEYLDGGEKQAEVERELLETLRRKEKHFGQLEEYDQYSIGHALHQLGRFYQDTGDHEQANEYFRKAVRTMSAYSRRVYGTVDTIDIAVGMTSLARNYLLGDKNTRNVDEAEKLLLKAYTVKEQRMPDATDSCQIGVYYLTALYREKGNTTQYKHYKKKIIFEEYTKLLDDTKREKEYGKVYPPETTVWL